jgi:hypothetical protein
MKLGEKIPSIWGGIFSPNFMGRISFDSSDDVSMSLSVRMHLPTSVAYRSGKHNNNKNKNNKMEWETG